MREIFERLARGEPLTQAEARQVMGLMMDGAMTPSQMGALLMALRVRGETVAELTGFAEAMRERVTRVPVAKRPLLDTCGTGGDGSHSINVSTLAGLVAAGAGARVAKHGNRSVSSHSGSADLLEALGIGLPKSPEEAGQLIDEVGFGFLFAPALHASMRHAMPTRRELGVRTVFNLLGPLTNPAGAEYQLLGVFAASFVEPVASVLAALGTTHAMVVHGAGMDEVSLAGPTLVAEVREGRIDVYETQPEQYGLSRVPLEAIRGESPQKNAAIAEQILAGGSGPAADTVALNAAFALYVADIAESVAAGLVLARQVLRSGQALAVVEALRAKTKAATA